MHIKSLKVMLFFLEEAIFSEDILLLQAEFLMELMERETNLVFMAVLKIMPKRCGVLQVKKTFGQ